MNDVNLAAVVLAVRAARARSTGGINKEADWREQIAQLVGKFRDPGVDLAGSLRGGGGEGEHWKNVGWEALRNALIGAGIGGAGGLASTAFSTRRQKQPLNRALRGALIGGALGGLGTGAYRGSEYALSDIPLEKIREQAKAEEAQALAQSSARARSVDSEKPLGFLNPVQQVPDMLDTLKQIEHKPATQVAREFGETVVGSPKATTFGVPVGAPLLGAAGYAAVPVAQSIGRGALDRWRLGTMLAETQPAGAAPLIRTGGRLRSLGKQFHGVDPTAAVKARNLWRKSHSLPLRTSPWLNVAGKGRLATGLIGTLLGRALDQRVAAGIHGTPSVAEAGQ